MQIISGRLERVPSYLFAQLVSARKEAEKKGLSIIDLGIGDPDIPTPPHIVERMREAVQNPLYHRYDETNKGLPLFREAVVRWYRRRFGVELDIEEVLTLIGCKEGLAHIIWAFVEKPDDIVLVPDPAYPVYRNNTLLAGGTPYPMPLKRENGFLPDLKAIPGEIARKAKLMFLNYPNNPTGSVATREFFEEVVEFALKNEIIVCHDCAYSEIYYDEPPISFLSVQGAKEVGVEFHSLSKTYNMTGWRIGFVVGNEKVINVLTSLKSHLDSGVFMAIQDVAAYALDNPQGYPEKMRAIYRERRDIMVEGLREAGFDVPYPPATFYIWVPLPPNTSSGEWAGRLLNETGIVLTPGRGYGENGEGYVRIALTIKGDDVGDLLREAVERIKKFMKKGEGNR
ncbi:LL-diaminopimelate aminotransferase [bacterium]|nr:LL-diaminopimelate aminotransferase [bacterium]